ncbi:MAG: transcriptional regulator [Chloroflexi bacterium]|nr:MAG: transcriptional regulator [Chloroflexota bacterium]
MTIATPTRTFDEIAVVLKALADPNRLRILDTLMQGVSCNGELNEWLGLPPNLLSHHLRVLKKAGLITSRRDSVDGRWIYYAVDLDAIALWRTWFGDFFDPDRLQPRCLCGPEGENQTPITNLNLRVSHVTTN